MLGDPVEKNAIAPIAITPRSMAITLVFRFVPFLARELRIQFSCNQTFPSGPIKSGQFVPVLTGIVSSNLVCSNP